MTRSLSQCAKRGCSAAPWKGIYCWEHHYEDCDAIRYGGDRYCNCAEIEWREWRTELDRRLGSRS